MKKFIISMLFCLGIVAVAVAEDASNYSYQNRMPFYGNYPLYNGKIINHYGNYGYRSPLMYGNKLPEDFYGQVPPKMYGNKPPKDFYGQVPPKMYGNRPPKDFYGQVPPKMYGNKHPKKSYGYLHPKAYSSTTPSANNSED